VICTVKITKNHFVFVILSSQRELSRNKKTYIEGESYVSDKIR